MGPDSRQSLPHSGEAERAVLGALLIDNSLLPAVSVIVKPEDFFNEGHRIIYEAQREVALNGGLDQLTLRAKLEESGKLAKIGGVAYLASLDLDLPDISQTEHYAQSVKERAQKRQLIEAAGDLTRGALGDEPLAQLVTKHEARLEGITAHASLLQVVSSEELLRMVLPPRELILSPILRKKDLAMIHAWRGTGKTWVGLGLAAAVAAGGRFLRWEAPEPRGVLYMDGEMPAEAIQERLAIIIQSCDLEPQRLNIVTPDLLEHGVPNLATPEGQAQIEQYLEGVDLLVLDHLSALFRGLGSENEAESWEPAQEFMLRLRREGVSCVLVHHSGKSGLQRGTSKREDVLDLVASLRRPRNYSPTEGARFEVHIEKARAAFGKDVEPFEARLETGPNGNPVWTVRDLEAQTYSETVRLAKMGLNGQEIADELGKHKSTISRHLSKAREQGELP